MFAYIENVSSIRDVVVSGGDVYYLTPEQIIHIGERLLSIPHIKRLRYASKGLAVCPRRIVDVDDTWIDALMRVVEYGRER